MGLFNRNGKNENEEDRIISEDDGSKKSDYIKEAEAFNQKMMQAVCEDKKAKKAFITIVVEENEKGDGAHNTIQCAGSKELLVYALCEFASKKGTSTLLRMALNFLASAQLKEQFENDFKK